MQAIRRVWTTASPAMLAGRVTASVGRPPRLVTKPCAPASPVWFTTSDSMASSTPDFLTRCFPAATFAPGTEPVPLMAASSRPRSRLPPTSGARATCRVMSLDSAAMGQG